MIFKGTIYIAAVLSAFLFAGCAVLPFGKKARILKSPAPASYARQDSMELADGNAPQRDWWICFSDRVNNSTQVSAENDMPQKKLAFLEPLFVIKQKADFVKVASYIPTLNLKESKGRADKKTLKIYGWIRKEKLLLWSSALKDMHTFFMAKAVTNIAGEDMFLKPEKYFSNDSLLLFSTPDLTERLPAKIAIGQLTYIYKISADKKSYLLGNMPFCTADSIKQTITGWISTNAVSVWGTRAAFTYNDSLPGKDDHAGLFISKEDSLPALSFAAQEDRTAFENIFPVKRGLQSDSVFLSTAYLGNVLDYSKNKILNVLGKPVLYNRYKEILKNSGRLNVVFVIDAGYANRLYLPSVKSALQDLQLYFDTTSSFKAVKFAAVMYRDTKCSNDTTDNFQPLTAKYSDVIKFIQEKEKSQDCSDVTVYRPADNALTTACSLLADVKDETNIIIITGTTGSDPNTGNIGAVASAVSRVQARLMFFQTINKSADAYNDFILSAEKTVIASSQNIAELKKEKLVNQDDVLANTAYSLQAGDSGIYYLDYPAKSMVQGFVLYPKKGDIMPAGMLKRNFDTLLHQVTADTRRTNQSLRTYFSSNIGIGNTSLLPGFRLFRNIPDPVPQEFVKSVINTAHPFFIPAYAGGAKQAESAFINTGVLLTEAEYDRQILYFNEVYQISGAGKEKFNRAKAVKNYIDFLNKYAAKYRDKKSRRKRTAQLTTAEALTLFTGYTAADTSAPAITLGDLKDGKNTDKPQVIWFFNRFKYAADAMTEHKNAAWVRINCNGTYYYWVDKKLMP